MSRDQELIYAEVGVIADSESDCRKAMRVLIEAVGAARLRFDEPTQDPKENTWIAYGELEAFVPIPGQAPQLPEGWRKR